MTKMINEAKLAILKSIIIYYVLLDLLFFIEKLSTMQVKKRKNIQGTIMTGLDTWIFRTLKIQNIK